jgi:amidase
VQFGVIGPLARTASDLALALGVLAGPDGDAARGYHLNLPPPRGERLADYRVLILDRHPLAGVDDAVVRPLHALADRLEAAGAEVARQSPLLPDFAAYQPTYMGMLGAIMGRGEPGATPPIDTFAYMNGLDAITGAQAAWSELFAEFDVVLAPPFGVPAFPHLPEGDWASRTLTINGAATPYGAQLGWAGIATFPGLPSTCAPIGKTPEGLPVGVQIIGPRYEDRTTIAFAGLIEREFGVAL